MTHFLWNYGQAWLRSLKMKAGFNMGRGSWVQAKKTAKTQESKNTWNAQGMLVRLEKGDSARGKETRDVRLQREISFFYLPYLNAKR